MKWFKDAQGDVVNDFQGGIDVMWFDTLEWLIGWCQHITYAWSWGCVGTKNMIG